MSHLILNVYKAQRMDITANVKDTDTVLEVFRKHNIKFDKKYTSLNSGGPCTITFKGICGEKAHVDISDAVFELYEKANSNEIGNVYVKFTSFVHKRKPESGAFVSGLTTGLEAQKEEPETTYAEVSPHDDTL